MSDRTPESLPARDPAELARAMARAILLRDRDDRIRQAAAIWGSTALELPELEPTDS